MHEASAAAGGTWRKTYFVRSADGAFVAEMTRDEVCDAVTRGAVKPDWSVTENIYRESYATLVKEARPRTRWSPAASLVEEALSDPSRRDEAPAIGAAMAAVAIGVAAAAAAVVVVRTPGASIGVVFAVLAGGLFGAAFGGVAMHGARGRALGQVMGAVGLIASFYCLVVCVQSLSGRP